MDTQSSTVARRARKNLPRDTIAHKIVWFGGQPFKTHPAGRPTQSKIPFTLLFFLWFGRISIKTASGRVMFDLLVPSSLFVICCDAHDIYGFERLSVSSLYVPREKTSTQSIVCINPSYIYHDHHAVNDQCMAPSTDRAAPSSWGTVS